MIEALLARMGQVFGSEGSANSRSLGYVWGFGATSLTVAVLLPHPRAANVGVLVAIAVIGYIGAALLFIRAATFSRVTLEAFTYVGQCLITALVFSWGAPDAPFLWYHVWLVVHSFHFLPPVRATRQIVCAAALFAFATVATHTPFPAAISVVGVGTIVAIGMLVGAFRVRVDELLQAAARNASTDPLTGLANRRAFAEAFATEEARRARGGYAGALLMLDCDRFKRVNDQQGHAAGDRALRSVAEVLSATVRAVDTPARLGGDEFAVLLSAPDIGAAVAVAERIRSAVVDRRDSDLLTLSIGVVELPAGDAVALDAALSAADRAMYESKDQGGDRVSIGALVDSRASNAPGLMPPVAAI
jgi:diguanylate cyclase (GGDEF)-like protein